MRQPLIRALIRALLRRLRAAALAGLLACLLPGGLRAESVDLTPEAAILLAQRAYLGGNPGLAHAIAFRLHEAGVDDPRLPLLLSATTTALGQPDEGRRWGARAWAAARGEPAALRHEIARHTAAAAFRAGELTRAQLWLRRAADTAPDAAARAATLQDFRAVRQQNPFSAQLRLAITPSDNLNGGAGDGALMVDEYYIGEQTGMALALEGLRSSADLRLQWRLPPDAGGQTSFDARLYGAFYSLTEDSKAETGVASGAALNNTMAEIGVTRALPLQGRALTFAATAGQSWDSGLPVGPHLRLSTRLPFGPQSTGLAAGLSAERQWRDGGPTTALQFSLSASQDAAGLGRLGWSLALRDVQADFVNNSYRSATAEISLEAARPLGPVRLGASAFVGLRDYPDYRLGHITVTDGREDERFGLSIDMTFEQIGVMGYAPSLSISSERALSNISRFDTRSLEIGLGIVTMF